MIFELCVQCSEKKQHDIALLKDIPLFDMTEIECCLQGIDFVVFTVSLQDKHVRTARQRLSPDHC